MTGAERAGFALCLVVGLVMSPLSSWAMGWPDEAWWMAMVKGILGGLGWYGAWWVWTRAARRERRLERERRLLGRLYLAETAGGRWMAWPREHGMDWRDSSRCTAGDTPAEAVRSWQDLWT